MTRHAIAESMFAEALGDYLLLDLERLGDTSDNFVIRRLVHHVAGDALQVTAEQW